MRRARLAYYIALFLFALSVVFLTMWMAKDRGSDAERLPPSVRGNPERPEAYDRGSDVGRHVAVRAWTP